MWFQNVAGEAAARLGYVNPGPDRRLGGALGRVLGQAQSALSFKSATPPARMVEQLGGDHGQAILVETETAPNGRQHLTVAIPRGNGRWATFRFGWRFDPHWGDERTHRAQPGSLHHRRLHCRRRDQIERGADVHRRARARIRSGVMAVHWRDQVQHDREVEAAAALVGKQVHFHGDTKRTYRVVAEVDGMVELDTLPGRFAAHLFVELPDPAA